MALAFQVGPKMKGDGHGGLFLHEIFQEVIQSPDTFEWW